MNTNQFAKEIMDIYPALLKQAYKLTTNRDDANDLVQDCILKALDNENKFVYQDNFKGWMYTIMRNIFINNYRQSMKELNVFKANLPEECLTQITNGESFDNIYDLKLLHNAIDNLPQNSKELFILFMDGLKYREIAEKCNLPLGTVKSRLHFARKQLQAELEEFI